MATVSEQERDLCCSFQRRVQRRVQILLKSWRRVQLIEVISGGVKPSKEFVHCFHLTAFGVGSWHLSLLCHWLRGGLDCWLWGKLSQWLWDGDRFPCERLWGRCGFSCERMQGGDWIPCERLEELPLSSSQSIVVLRVASPFQSLQYRLTNQVEIPHNQIDSY